MQNPGNPFVANGNRPAQPQNWPSRPYMQMPQQGMGMGVPKAPSQPWNSQAAPAPHSGMSGQPGWSPATPPWMAGRAHNNAAGGQPVNSVGGQPANSVGGQPANSVGGQPVNAAAAAATTAAATAATTAAVPQNRPVAVAKPEIVKKSQLEQGQSVADKIKAKVKAGVKAVTGKVSEAKKTAPWWGGTATSGENGKK
jgi:hypothetical protein